MLAVRGGMERFLVLALVAGCTLGGGEAVDQSAVVGGQPETGYPPVGYLVNSLYPAYKTFCGVTLIAPQVVVTAAHCASGYTASELSVGFGAAGSTPTIPVTAVHVHPSFTYRADGDYAPWDDVAILELATAVPGIAPATIARAATGTCDERYVGYGRDTTGDATVTGGYDSERKSTGICADGENAHELYVHGVDGGLCWGDSGGPLLVDGTTRILGVLSRHAPRIDSHYSCENGNRMIFTALASYHDFIAQWAPGAFEPDPAPGPAVGWCNVQWPPTVNGQRFADSDAIYGRVWVAGVTPGAGQGPGVLAEVGFGAAGQPWIWYGAHYNVDADGLAAGDRANDEYMGRVFPYASGTYDVAYRFSSDGARTWSTCQGAAKLVVP